MQTQSLARPAFSTGVKVCSRRPSQRTRSSEELAEGVKLQKKFSTRSAEHFRASQRI